jgi:hypothetical protein
MSVIRWKNSQTNDGDAFAVAVGHIQLWKSQTAGADKSMRIAGLISTDSVDLDGERVLQDGLDFTEFLTSGYFNDDHDKSVVLGRPEVVKYLRKGQRMPCGLLAHKDGWYVEGYLLHTPRVIDPKTGIWTLAKSSSPSAPTLAFSLEGIYRVCDAVGGWIKRAIIRNVAITDCPTNLDTQLVALAKSLSGRASAGMESASSSGQVLQAQSLEDSEAVDATGVQGEHSMSGNTDIAALVASVRELEKSVKAIGARDGLAADPALAGLAGKNEVDGEDLVKSLVARTEKVLGGSHSDMTAIAQLQGATVGLVKSQHDKIVELTNANAALKTELAETKELLKSVDGKLDKLLAQPNAAKGATGGANNGVQDRNFGAGAGAAADDAKKYGTAELQKSLDGKIQRAMQAKDDAAVSRLTTLQARVETGSSGKALANEIESVRIVG